MKMPISKRALIQRINRRLKEDEQVLKTYRGGQWYTDLGDYYIVNFNRNAIVRGHVDLQELGRKLGALAKYEVLADEAKR